MSTTLTEQFSKGLEDVVAGTTSICTINPDNESLLYRGYSATDLAENATFEEVAHLLIEGRLPKKRELKRITKSLIKDRKIPKLLIKILRQLPKTANPMDVLRTSVSFMGAIEENRQYSIEETKLIAYSLIAKLPFALMTWYHLSKEQPVPKISKNISYAGRFLQLVTGKEPDPFEEKVINASFILYAEHEFNASTFAARVAASTLSDIYSALTAGICTLKGPLHGGANEAAMELILKFNSPQQAESGINDLLNRKEKIMGFGHRVYKKGDGRAYVMKKYSQELATKIGNTKLFDIAQTIERVVKEKKGLFPNADFYSAVAYYLLGIPIPLYTPIFVLSRTSGWSAHIIEQLSDNRLIRPRAIYQGPPPREFVPIDRR
ncbi:MAG: 2-methylcitrate synthase [Candidatus Melainabacteria bacterium RIFCSPHIGHO2_02_FULL_34_12]|nr:MAG: 2-methylcitrate synthase [Candidatus Melainabacteria bacterium RIFCSPHIGHO2_02_FULL_34_12]